MGAYTISAMVSIGASYSFGSSSTSSSSNSSSTNWYTNMSSLSQDYASIRSGTYKKLLSSYYSMDQDSSSSSTTELSEEKKLAQIKLDADSLTDATKAIATSEDKVSAVKEFAESYNALIESSAETEDTKVLKGAVNLVNTTSTYKSTLARVGITVNSDNTLTIDEEKLSQASESDLKLLFDSRNSYASKVIEKASSISTSSKNSAALYTVNGTYSQSTSNLFSTYY